MISLATCPRNISPIIRAADPEEAIFYAGEACDEVIELKSGIVRAVRLSRDGHRQILSFFCAGDYLGSPAMHIHAFTAEAVTPVRYHRYSKSRWTAQLRQDGCDDGNLFWAIQRQQELAAYRGLVLGLQGMQVRLCAFFSFIIGGLTQQPDGTFVVPISQVDIAAYLATNPACICRALRCLRERRLLTVSRRDGIRLTDPDGIQHITNIYL
jgi:CRP-like cAMP-binding protein